MTGTEGEEAPAAPADDDAVTIAAALRPAEANAARERLLGALEAAQARGGALAVDLDGAPAWPCAVQLLAAAEKSARAAGVAFAPGPAAAAARIPLDDSETPEQRSQ